MIEAVPSQMEISEQIKKIRLLREERGIRLRYFYGKEGYIKINIDDQWLLYHEAKAKVPYLEL